jgi:hypothetical protein
LIAIPINVLAPSQAAAHLSESLIASMELELELERRKCLLSVGRNFLDEDDHRFSPFGHERFFNVLLDRLHQLAGLTNPLRS